MYELSPIEGGGRSVKCMNSNLSQSLGEGWAQLLSTNRCTDTLQRREITPLLRDGTTKNSNVT